MKPRRFAPRQEKTGSPGCTEPTLVLVPRTKYRHCSARARDGKPDTGLTRQLCTRSTPVAPALHSAGTASAPCLAYAPSFRRPQTAETVRTARACPKSKMAARLRPARTVIARDASHGQDTAIRREAPPGQNIGSSREHGHFPDATLRWRSISPPGKMADLTDKTILV